MPKKKIEDIYELSPMQQGMLFHNLYAPESDIYHLQVSFSLFGNLNHILFKKAWQYLVDRHEVMRNTFVWEGLEKPYQVVHPHVEITIAHRDWRDIPPEKKKERLEQFLQEDRSRPLPLTEPPLMRMTLIHLSDNECNFVWTFHHIILEGWSASILLNEVFAIYDSLTRYKNIQLPPIRPYHEYIQWLNRQDHKQAEEYWTQALRGFMTPTRLSMDYSHPANESSTPFFHQDEKKLVLSRKATTLLRDFARRHQLTINTLIQGAWSIVLSRYSGQKDIVLGVVTSGRPATLPGAKSIVGLFINTLPARVSIREDDPTINWLKDLQIRQAEMRQYEYSSLIDIQGWSEVPRDRRLFEYLIVFENRLADASIQFQSEGLKISDIRTINGGSEYPLTLVGIPGEELKLIIQYDIDRFDPEVIEQMLEHLHTLLKNMMSQLNCQISLLPMLSKSESHKLLVIWNRTQTDYPHHACIHELFEEQAEKTPKKIAAIFDKTALTYDELNSKANQLARRIRDKGIKPDSIVGILINKSMEMIIGILGIIKAGGAYLPIDPHYPEERINYLLKDSNVKLLLTTGDLISKVSPNMMMIDLNDQNIYHGEDSNLPNCNKPHDLLYIIYTSGTTGKPKGVCIPHSSLVNHMNWIQRAYSIDSTDIILQKTPYTFDASVWEFYATLLIGGKLIIAKTDGHKDPSYLIELINKHKITILQVVPSLLKILLDTKNFKTCSSLKRVFCGGEPLNKEIRDQFFNLLNASLINLYGPTECTIDSTHYLCSDKKEVAIVPIGKPIDNTQIFILDSTGSLAPIGIPGELCIGGSGLARGYLNHPDLTAKKFISDPFSQKAGARLYKTGDLARYLPDGNIEFLGRLDDQVKLRGFRIELGEIESVLRNHELVGEAVVLLREDEPGDKRLVGYVVPREEELLSIEDLLSHLKQKLPDHMIPSFFVQLESLPLTPNGKLDKRALPLPDPYATDLSSQFVESRTPIERALVEIWSDVLKRGRIGIHDNFFHLGGHSLLATQVISRVNKTFRLSLPVAEMFEHPTVGEFASDLKSRMRQEESGKVPLIKPVERKEEMPLSFAQERLWFLDQLEPDSPAYNMPLAIELKGVLDQEALQKSVNELIRRHESLRTRFELRDGKPFQLIDVPRQMDIPVVDLSKISDSDRETEIHRLIKEESVQPFDLMHGPLLRVKLLRITEADHIMLLTMHHIVSDGWSMGVLFHELTVLYESYMKGRPSPLQELPVQYADFAVWQRNWLSGQALASQMSYWKQQLSGELSVLNLPTDYPYPAMQTFNGAWQSIQLSKELSESLKALSHREHVTLFMTLLAAFKVLLYRYTGQEDIIVGSPVANRNRAEIEDLIGFFVNMLVLRSQVSDTQSFLDFLAQVRETTLAAYTHQDLPFEKLVDEIETDRDLSRSALFQVVFALQNAPMEPLDLVGLQINPVEMEGQTTRFELEVHVWERGGRLRVVFVYNRDLFASSTIQRMMNHYRTLLEGIVSNPECRIPELALLSQSERQELLDIWNVTQTDYPKNTCIHELFESQVQRDSNAVAMVFNDQQLTYGQLNVRANQLAHHLRTMGVRKGSPVAVCLERSIEMVVSMLGILKAGGTYVPLDVNYPLQRLFFMLQDTGSDVLLTHEGLSDRFSGEGLKIVCLDRDKDLISSQTASDLKMEISGDDLAYIMYTSGSTGIPKGAEVLHRGVVRLVCETDYIQLGPADRMGHLSNCSFDAATFEVWGALLSGARLVVLDQDTVLSPWILADRLQAEGINVLFLTTALFNLLAKESPHVLAGIGHLLFGGEAVNSQWVRRVVDQGGAGRLLHVYGPTENTTFTTWYEVSSVPEGAVTVPIGRPIANTRVYILDRNMEPVPVGVPGELYIGGDGLARGYLNRPELTLEKFVDDPFSKEPGSRLYRTGDLVCWRADGNIEFLGRHDDQIKLRGFRIELGEIENVLCSHPAVQEGVVLLREDDPGEKRLVAYVVQQPHGPGPQEQPSNTELSADQVSHWAMIFDDYIYNQPAPHKDTTFNTSGWNSSYTDQPIPEEEMRVWLEDTVDQILCFHPRRVLEIGCGTGLLLFRIAPHCSRYWGTDISPRAIKYIREQLHTLDLKPSDFALLQRKADDFKDIEVESFDSVILNSVVQYFPDIYYLLRVLEGAVNAVKPGGFVFVGDVRSFPLLEAFHTSVQLYQAEDSLSLRQLRQGIQRQIMKENELTIDPAFFTALKQHLPKVSQVAIRPKRGRYHNELIRFRYQVIIYIGPQADPPLDISWMDWQKEDLTPSAIRRLLLETEPEILGLRGAKSARVSSVIKTVKLLKNNNAPETAGKLREMIAGDEVAGVDPEDLWALNDELPYLVDIRLGNTGSEDSFDVVFKRNTSAKGKVSRRGINITEEKVPLKPWNEYANNPMQVESTREFEPQLRNFLSEMLPEYMVPAAFVFLNALPLTPNGKVDKRALPALDPYATGLSSQYVEPRTPIEQALVEIWSGVLKRDGIGINDNFFHLGGHSLLATQVISRVNETFGVPLPVAEMFEHPTLGEFASELALRMRQEEFEQAPPIKPVERKKEMPLSFAQQRLWFISQLVPDSPAYNMQLAIELKGELDQEALRKSLNELVRRHESLRSHFDMRDGQSVQLIDVTRPVDIPVIDISEMDDSDCETEVHRLVTEESLRPFDLMRGPLLRAKLLRIAEADHILLLMMHHIVSDGWSMGVLFHELTVLYESYTKGRPSPLPELPIQYSDFAVWQRQWLSGEVMDTQMSYWRQQLSGKLPVLDLPTDYPRPAIQTFNGSRQSIQLSKELSESLKTLSHREHITLFMTMLSAFKVLLYRYTGQEDIIVGSPVANRNRAEIEVLIGCFVNMLVLRSHVSDTQSFRELLAQVRETTLGAYAHQDLPFEKLVDEFETDRDLSRSALFQVVFALQNAPMEPLDLVGLQLKPVEMDCQTTRFELEVHVWERDGRLKVVFIYNRDLFVPSTIERMMNHYRLLLEEIVSNPERRISELPLLNESERQTLLEVWNRTQTDYPRNTPIQELFELQVKQILEAVAVVFKDQHITYNQLNERANQLAHHLRSLGVKRGSLVAVCLERSIEMVVSMLGILKAGGAYVPLDINYPQQRLSFMLQDTKSDVLLTREDLLNHFSSEAMRVVCLDRDKDLINTQPVSNLKLEVCGDDLAYVMYTSGSTGTPKGVEVLHRSVVRLVCETDYIQLGAKDRMAHISNCSFDASTFEVWGALLSGARLVVLDQETVLSPRILADRLQAEGINVLFLTTALFNLLAKELPEVLANMEHLLFGGEVVDPQCVRKVIDEKGTGRLLHVYGPTENTTFTTWYEVSSVSEETVTVPIGLPIANTRVYVLDKNMAPVPVGVPGELYIGGDGLARGYLNRPQLTSEKFVDDPFSKELGLHLYRTGDLVRWRADGNIEFLGRQDDQIKLRGFRIELGEIEFMLRNHDLVEEAVVLLREHEPGDKSLVGYVVPRSDGSPSVEDLRAYLRQKLPEYMVPAAFVFLNVLPLTPNGKVDKRALPAPDPYATGLSSQYIEPRTPIEQALVEIWSGVLRRDGIGINDNFFHLGGHSLLATQVISRVNETFGVSLPVAEMFEHPTLGEFASELALRMRQEEFEQAPPIKPVERKKEMPLSFAQQRLWFISQLVPDSPAYNMQLAIELKGELDQEALRKSLNELVRRHESLRSHFDMRDGQSVQLIDVTRPVDIPVIDISEMDDSDCETEVHRLVTEESLRPFDLMRGPLLRAKLLRIAEADHILLLMMHHIVSDGWSMGVLFHELTVLYESYTKGRPSPLPELPIQYSDFAVWQRQWLSGEVMDTQMSYWRQQLSGKLPVLDLPTDYPRPAIQTFNGSRQSIQLSKELSESLKTLSHREHITLFMTMLSAFKVLLYRYTGQEDIIVGSPVANRNRAEIEVLIGCFVNMLVLRSHVSDTQSFRELLAQVRETTLGAYAHQDLPFEKLVDEFETDRDLSRSALFQVVFALQNAPMEPLDLVGLQLKPVEMDCQTTRFELEVHVWERDGRLKVVFIYNRDLFVPSTIERMMNHYRLLLEEIVSNPERRISELPLLNESERQTLLEVWNRTQTDYPRQSSIQELFELQVKRLPETVAVVYEDQRLTYSQLNERANQLAHYLRSLGVRRGDLVAVCLERSIEMVAAMLGILKAGGAYVPLDVSYPAQRLWFMLEDSGPKVLLTRQDLLDRFSDKGLQVVCLDRDKDLVGTQPVSDLKLKVCGDDLAYVMYTSGSTGKPKGVEILHRGVVRLVCKTDYIHLSEKDRMTHISNCSFDAATFEVWGALLSGARLVVLDQETVLSPQALADRLQEEQINVMFLTTSLFNLLAKESPKVLAGVEHLLFGGEAANPHWVGQVLNEDGIARLINLYGPTENTTVATWYEVSSVPEEAVTIPIGRPIANTRVYVLDSRVEPVPVGVAGELYIGGDGLARGYLNRPELTAERFVDDTFSKEADSRLYRTGDLVRWLPDGILEFLGRQDDQVKLRGFRIELGEIEFMLRNHDLVEEAVVLLREDEPGEKHLVGYVVPRADVSLSVEDLRDYLKQKLPEYMVPSYFVQLEAFPLTPNRKVDRRVLPVPEGERQLKKMYVEPKTKLEKSIVNIWKKVLRIDKVGIHDNFFDLGGNSLKMISVRSKLAEITETNIPMLNMFRYPTVSALVAYLREEKQALPDVVDERKIVQDLSKGKSRLKRQLGKSKKLTSKRS